MHMQPLFARLAAFVFALVGLAASAMGQDTDKPASAPPASEQHTMTSSTTIRCDEDKTTILQNRFVSTSGVTSALIIIVPVSGNLYTVRYVGKNIDTLTYKEANEKEARILELSTWLFLVEADSPNYFLHTQRQPNDCRIEK